MEVKIRLSIDFEKSAYAQKCWCGCTPGSLMRAPWCAPIWCGLNCQQNSIFSFIFHRRNGVWSGIWVFLKSNGLGWFVAKHGDTLKSYQVWLLVRGFQFEMIRFERLVEKNVVIKIAKHIFLPLTTCFGWFFTSYLKLLKIKLKAVVFGPIWERFFLWGYGVAFFCLQILVGGQSKKNSYGFDQICHWDLC